MHQAYILPFSSVEQPARFYFLSKMCTEKFVLRICSLCDTVALLDWAAAFADRILCRTFGEFCSNVYENGCWYDIVNPCHLSCLAWSESRIPHNDSSHLRLCYHCGQNQMLKWHVSQQFGELSFLAGLLDIKLLWWCPCWLRSWSIPPFSYFVFKDYHNSSGHH